MLNLEEQNKVTTPFLLESLLFKGQESSPFLAPRGIWMYKGKLFVSDTGQNRVFIWNTIPKSTFQKADVVLGQVDSQGTQRNAGTEATASTLHYPSGIWSDGNILIIADAWNHRVLVWNTFPKENGQEADVVIGQPDFKSNLPNVAGIGKNPDSNTLNWPYGVHSDGEQLWVADTGNRRVLHFKTIPNKNFQSADSVIGKSTFDQRDYENEDPIWPYSVRVSKSGQMTITDTQYFRVLYWKHWKNALKNKAERIIGQKDLQGKGQNQYLLKPEAFTLNWCYDSFFQNEETLWVVDTGNSRILKFDPVPEINNQSAVDLIGHDDFITGSENKKTMFGTENALYWPFGICVDNDIMAIADTGNHRIIIKTIDK